MEKYKTSIKLGTVGIKLAFSSQHKLRTDKEQELASTWKIQNTTVRKNSSIKWENTTFKRYNMKLEYPKFKFQSKLENYGALLMT